jgi:Fe-S cluster biosynthesis and repair protein YggX
VARLVNCIKLGREAEGLDLPPMPGELGKKLWENVSKEAWQQWIKLQTMIINENRLSLADPQHRNTLPSRSRNISSAMAPIRSGATFRPRAEHSQQQKGRPMAALFLVRKPRSQREATSRSIASRPMWRTSRPLTR